MHININGCKLFFDVYGSKLKILPTEVKEKPTLIVLHGGHGSPVYKDSPDESYQVVKKFLKNLELN
ncbi:MAG: hypothetical protein Q7V63_09625 [Gammaproteobacteria bacterium]|nr:hypothetical protein [Gammaproteobacteria bacterium]